MSSAAVAEQTTREIQNPLISEERTNGEDRLTNSHHGDIEKHHNRKRKMRTRLEKFLVVVIVVLLVALVVFAINFYKHLRTDKEHSEQTTTVCVTTACTKTAARVINSLDPEINPCDNFYDFACGGMIKALEIPDDRANIFSYSLLREGVTKTMKNSLEKPISDDDIESVINVKKLYRSCVNEDLIESQNLTSMFRLLDEFGGWPLLGDGPGGHWSEPEFNMVQLLLALLKYNNQPVVPVWVGTDDRNNSRRIVTIDQQWFGMPNRVYYIDPLMDIFKTVYRKLILNISVMLGADRATVDQEVDSLLELETELAKITVSENDRRSSAQYYNKMTLQQLVDMTDPVETARLKFDWLSFINGALQLPNVKNNVTHDEEIVVQSIPYYERLWGVLAKFPKRTIANYMVWRIVKNRAVNLPKRFRKEIEVYNQALYGHKTAPPRWKTCVNYIKVTFEMVLGRMFVVSSFDNTSRVEAVNMIGYVMDSFKELVDNLDWMDDQMKAVAKEKAENMVDVVGYPDYILDNETLNSMYGDMPMNDTTYFENVLTVLERDARDALDKLREYQNQSTSRESWSTAPTTVNAYYSFQKNQITFPAGILQPPYFSKDQPRSINYGGIGFMMGHEVTHGFDDQGREYDKDGNLYDWWSIEAARMFKKRAQCMIQQYGEFVSPQAGINVDGVRTQGENIADNGAVKQAYWAYRKWVQQQGKEEPRLPGLNYTHDQLFFINVAQIRCGLSRPEDALSHIQNGIHSPNRFRVLGSLMNFDQFSKVFNCPMNSYMNPTKKCSVW